MDGGDVIPLSYSYIKVTIMENICQYQMAVVVHHHNKNYKVGVAVVHPRIYV